MVGNFPVIKNCAKCNRNIQVAKEATLGDPSLRVGRLWGPSRVELPNERMSDYEEEDSEQISGENFVPPPPPKVSIGEMDPCRTHLDNFPSLNSDLISIGQGF